MGNQNLRSSPEGKARPASYWHVSRSTWYSFWFVLPPLVLYEVLFYSQTIQGIQVINGADAILRLLLQPLFNAFGMHGPGALGLIVLIVGMVLLWTRDPATRAVGLQGKYFLWMAVESLIYALLLGSVVVTLMRFFAIPVLQWTAPAIQMGGGIPLGATQAFMLSLGAGVFEELLFRMLLMGGIVWFLVKIGGLRHGWALALGIAISSFIFSSFHYVGNLGDRFTLESFCYRFWAGVCLATIYGLRGFGIAVWTHVLYDLTVFFGKSMLG